MRKILEVHIKECLYVNGMQFDFLKQESVTTNSYVNTNGKNYFSVVIF